MDEETAQLSVDRRYVRLVRLAYLVLPATGRRRYRLAVAQRIVDISLSRRSWPGPSGGRGYAPTRARVLRYAMRPPRRLRVGLARRLRSLPQGPPPTPEAFAALAPAVRAAYVLRRAESLPRYVVRDHLVGVGVTDAMEIVEVADGMPELVLPRVVPGPPLRRRSPLPVAIASVITVVAIVTAQNDTLARRVPSAAPRPSATAPRELAAVRTQPPAVASARPPAAAPANPAVGRVTFWTGRLPGGAVARWTCTRATSPGRPTRTYATLFIGGHRLPTGHCGSVRGATLGGTWWRARNGRWYFLAAADPRFVPVVLVPRAWPPPPPARAGLVAVAGPRGYRRPNIRMIVRARPR